MNIEGEGSPSFKSEFGVIHKGSLLGLVAPFTLSNLVYTFRSLSILKPGSFSYAESRFSTTYVPQTFKRLSPKSKTDCVIRYTA